jgi:demethylmenaquinone methyltransferase/2-methoxy-6-polyprenyl-1,4-benzoquinol methylase
VLEIVAKSNPDTILDIATGGDLAILMTQTNATKL